MILVESVKIPDKATVRGRVCHVDDDRRIEVVRYRDDCLIQIWNGTKATRVLLSHEAACAMASALGSALDDWDELLVSHDGPMEGSA